MNLLGSRILSDTSEDARTRGAEKVASNQAAPPVGERGPSARGGKEASDASRRSEFENLLAADEALPHAPSAKSAKKGAPESSTATPTVDPARLAAVLADSSRRMDSDPPVPALPLTSGSPVPVGAETDAALAPPPSTAPADETPAHAATSPTDAGTAATPAPPLPAPAALPDVQLAVAVASLGAPALDATPLKGAASAAPSTPSNAAVSRVRPAAEAAPRVASRVAPAADTKDASAAKDTGTASAPETDSSSAGSKPEARADAGTAKPADPTESAPRAPVDLKSASGDAASDRFSAQKAQATSAASRSAAGAASEPAVGAIATRSVAFADAPPSVNVMTSAKGVSAAERPLDASSPVADTNAATSAVNQQIIRSTAHGVIELPELGRIQVSAKSQDGELGVRVTADRPETTTILLPHAAAMAAEARSTGSSNVRVDVESRHSAMGSYTGSWGGSGREAGRQATTDSHEVEEGVEVDSGAARPRVRIVL